MRRDYTRLLSADDIFFFKKDYATKNRKRRHIRELPRIRYNKSGRERAETAEKSPLKSFAGLCSKIDLKPFEYKRISCLATDL